MCRQLETPHHSDGCLRRRIAYYRSHTAQSEQHIVLCVEQGKGAKDRYVVLSPQLLEILRTWRQITRPET